MDPWAPINGISLERYAELAADVAETQDPARQAEIVARKGVSALDWEAAKSGWTGRMQDMSLMGQVAARFMPMYQAALARKGAAPAGPPHPGAAPGAASEPAQRAVSGAMPGAVPPPAYGAAPGYGQQPGYPPPGYGAQPGYAQPAYPQPAYPQTAYPQPAYPQQPGYNQQAAQLGAEVGNAFNAFGNALGSMVNSVIGTFTSGQAVMVQWSDGHRYPATVLMAHSGQVQVAFPDGRQVWVPQAYVALR